MGKPLVDLVVTAIALDLVKVKKLAMLETNDSTDCFYALLRVMHFAFFAHALFVAHNDYLAHFCSATNQVAALQTVRFPI